MENNKKNRELYKIYLEIGHDPFEEKIKKPMKLYLHNNHASSHVISMISLNAIVATGFQTRRVSVLRIALRPGLLRRELRRIAPDVEGTRGSVRVTRF